MTSGDDLVDDIRWFFSQSAQGWDARPNRPDADPIALKRSIEALYSRSPCVLSALVGRDDVETKLWQERIRSAMKSLGFYAKPLANRPTREALNSRLPLVSRQRGRLDPPIQVFVYQASENDDCRKDADRAKCAFRNEARTRAANRNGKAIAILPSEGVKDLWRKLVAATQGRSITRLEILGHGARGGQKVSRHGVLDAASLAEGELSQDLPQVAARMAPNAEIRLYGCEVGQPDRIGVDDAKLLATRLGSWLLSQGGLTVMFTTKVLWDPDKKRLLFEPPASAQTPRKPPFLTPPCTTTPVLDSVLKLMMSMLGKYQPA